VRQIYGEKIFANGLFIPIKIYLKHFQRKIYHNKQKNFMEVMYLFPIRYFKPFSMEDLSQQTKKISWR